ncbi:PH domain-containing protein [Agrococcus sp. Marseille-P2731]|uniref:PH domain-containing protein n=1 Tax=Agrococcus sp. Marseille-P2731 TaxID=1841862 RepID=UPI0009F85363|nr:PH domain-containing protein [Agrococcus sp. Marseille-P2731]
MNDDPRAVTVHSRVNRGMAIFCWALLAVLGALGAMQAEPRGAVAAVIAVVWLAYAAFVVLWAPALVVDRAGCEIRNPLRTVRVAWEALIHVDTRYSLTLFTPNRRWPVWCAPQAGRLSARRKARRAGDDDRDPRDPRNPLDAGMRIGDVPGTESGDAARLVRDRWASAPRGADAEAVAVPVVLHWSRVAALAAGPLLIAGVPLLF